MPKSIWNGTITFGMVNVPVKLYSATESKSIHFHEVHAKDGARIEHRRICPREDKEGPYKEVVKGYEDDVLVLHTLRFHDEVVEGEDLEIERSSRKPSQKEIQMAGQLVKALAADFNPDGYEDTYRDAVLDLIKRKARGEEIDLLAEEEP